MTRSGQKLEKVTLSPIKKRNRKKTRTFVELPFVVSQRNQLKTQLAQLLQKGCEDSGINSAGPSYGHINQDTDGEQVKGFPDSSCNPDEPTQMLVDIPPGISVDGTAVTGTVVGSTLNSSREPSQATTAVALCDRWRRLLPTLQEPLLAFTANSTARPIIPVKDDLVGICLKGGTSSDSSHCTTKRAPVLCLFADRRPSASISVLMSKTFSQTT